MTYKKTLYRQRILLILCILLILPYLVISVFTLRSEYVRRNNALREEMRAAILEGLNNFKRVEDDIYARMFFVLNHSKINEVLTLDHPVEPRDMVDAGNEISRAISAAYLGKSADSITLYSSNPYTHSLSVIRKIDGAQSEAFGWIPDPDRVYVKLETVNESQMLCYYKKFNLQGGYLNVIRYQLPFSNITDCFRGIEEREFGLFLAGNGGEFIRIAGDGPDYHSQEEILSSNRLYQSVDTQLLDGKIYGVVNGAVEHSELRQGLLALLILFLLMLAVLMGGMLFMVNYLANGVAVITDCIRRDDFTALEETTFYNKEMNMLKDYLFEQKEKLTAEHKAKYEAAVLANSRRMSPHFLYNSLGAIRNLADNPDTRACINLLVRYYRYVFRSNAALVRASAELEMMDIYTRMLRISYNREFDYQAETRQGTEHCLVPSNLLQPLVENAFIHGINYLPEGGEIRVRLELAGDRLRLSVANTAREAQRDARMIGLALERSDSALGLIRTRLELIYGADYKIESFAPLPETVEVRLEFPAKPEEDDERGE